MILEHEKYSYTEEFINTAANRSIGYRSHKEDGRFYNMRSNDFYFSCYLMEFGSIMVNTYSNTKKIQFSFNGYAHVDVYYATDSEPL